MSRLQISRIREADPSFGTPQAGVVRYLAKAQCARELLPAILEAAQRNTEAVPTG
jgi:hypothetical protein